MKEIKRNFLGFSINSCETEIFFERWLQHHIPHSQKHQNATSSKANFHNVKNPYHQNTSSNLDN
jgi:hypothetical protein